MKHARSPLLKVREALERGYHTVDVRSDASGVEVELRRGTERKIVRLSPDDARRILTGESETVHAGHP